MATMQMYVIMPSPLVKICLPEWETKLKAKPDLIYDDKTDFYVMVDSGSRSYRVPFNKPVQIVYADPKYVANKSEIANPKMANCRVAPEKPENIIWVRDPKDLESTFNYLTGAAGGVSARQTDCFGIVPFDPENAIVRDYEELALMDDLLSSDPKVAEAAKKKLIQSRIESAKRKKAITRDLLVQSEERIKRHLRGVHNNLIRQWQINEENNLGKYPPSLSERLGFKVLDPEIKAKDDETAETARIANEMMKRPAVG